MACALPGNRFALTNSSFAIFYLTNNVTYVTFITHEEFNYARKSSLPRERRKMEQILITKQMKNIINRIKENLNNEEEFKNDPLNTEEIVYWAITLFLDVLEGVKDE